MTTADVRVESSAGNSVVRTAECWAENWAAKMVANLVALMVGLLADCWGGNSVDLRAVLKDDNSAGYLVEMMVAHLVWMLVVSMAEK